MRNTFLQRRSSVELMGLGLGGSSCCQRGGAIDPKPLTSVRRNAGLKYRLPTAEGVLLCWQILSWGRKTRPQSAPDNP